MKSKRYYKGQSLVEFALILPLLLVLVFGAIDFGRLFYTKTVLTNAAREGAYYLVSHHDDADVIANATLAAQTEAQISGICCLNVEFDPTSGWNSNDNIEVTTSTTVNGLIIFNILDSIAPISQLSSSVEMLIWQ